MSKNMHIKLQLHDLCLYNAVSMGKGKRRPHPLVGLYVWVLLYSVCLSVCKHIATGSRGRAEQLVFVALSHTQVLVINELSLHRGPWRREAIHLCVTQGWHLLPDRLPTPHQGISQMFQGFGVPYGATVPKSPLWHCASDILPRSVSFQAKLTHFCTGCVWQTF